MLKTRALVVAGLIAWLAASAGPAAAETRSAYGQALADAKARNQIVLLDFFTDW